MAENNRWLELLAENPGHSSWYVERFRSMAAEGKDLDGEARMLDAMVGREARILDAGCGPGRIGGRLHELGHEVVGVDLDPELIAAAVEDYPDPTWHVGDLSKLDLPGRSGENGFDLIFAAGNVMAFLDPATRRAVLAGFLRHLAPNGRAVVGFGSGRDYDFEDFFADAAFAGLSVDASFSTWDLRPLNSDSDFLVAIMSAAAVAHAP